MIREIRWALVVMAFIGFTVSLGLIGFALFLLGDFVNHLKEICARRTADAFRLF